MTLRQRVIASALLAVAAGLFLVAGLSGRTGGDDTLVTTSGGAVEELIPAPGTTVLRQSHVGIDLASGYAAELYLNDVRIPPEQLNRFRNPDDPRVANPVAAENVDVGLNRFVFQPQSDHVIAQLNGEENCARAVYWPLANPADRRTVEWCFRAS